MLDQPIRAGGSAADRVNDALLAKAVAQIIGTHISVDGGWTAA